MKCPWLDPQRLCGIAKLSHIGSATVEVQPANSVYWPRSSHFSSGVRVWFLPRQKWDPNEPQYFNSSPRFQSFRADTVLFCGGQVVIDLQTGHWRRFTVRGGYYTASRVLVLLQEQARLEHLMDRSVWPRNLNVKLRAIVVQLYLLRWRGWATGKKVVCKK